MSPRSRASQSASSILEPDLRLVRPAPEHLPSYLEALRAGYSPRPDLPGFAEAQIERIERDPEGFLDELNPAGGAGPPVPLPDGSAVQRLPGLQLWMWDGEFCGNINFRWQPGTTELPPTCLGHIGYTVAAWKQRRGYATRALALLLAEIDDLGLPFVELVTDVGNHPSQRVIEANGGQLVEVIEMLPAHGGGKGLRYRIFRSKV